jgi:hypothetical protein
LQTGQIKRTTAVCSGASVDVTITDRLQSCVYDTSFACTTLTFWSGSESIFTCLSNSVTWPDRFEIQRLTSAGIGASPRHARGLGAGGGEVHQACVVHDHAVGIVTPG